MVSPEPTAPKRSNARGRATREQLERAALELFLRDGYDETTVERIADEAGVSERTFFHHFPTKADALWGDSFAEIERFAELLADRTETDTTQALLAAIVEHGHTHDLNEIDLLRYRVVQESGLNRDHLVAYEEEFRAILIEWLSKRSGRPPTDVGVRAAAAALNAMRGVVSEAWGEAGGEVDGADLAREALSTMRLDNSFSPDA